LRKERGPFGTTWLHGEGFNRAPLNGHPGAGAGRGWLSGRRDPSHPRLTPGWPTILSGIRVLIVEDEALAAAALSDAAEDAGGVVVGIARTVGEARQIIKETMIRLRSEAANSS
jgi:hypothetical protein